MNRRKLVNAVSIFVIVVSVLTIAAVVVLGSRMFKERGSSLVLSGTAQKVISESAWDGKYSNFLLCGIDKTEKLTDVIMVVSLDNQTGQITILQIPRDTYSGKDVPSHKYNAIYGHAPEGVSGMENLKAHILRDFGIPINHYAAITTDGFDKLVDSVGGVDLYVPRDMNYDDRAQDLHIHLKKGYQHLTGNQAEQLVRERKIYINGDLGRLDTQKLFLAAFAKKLKEQNIFTLSTKVLPTLMPPSFTTDLSTAQILQFGLSAKKVNLDNVQVMTLPGEPYTDPDTKLSYFSAYKADTVNLVNHYFIHDGSYLTMDDISIVQKVKSPNSANAVSSGTQNFQNIYDSQQQQKSGASSGR